MEPIEQRNDACDVIGSQHDVAGSELAQQQPMRDERHIVNDDDFGDGLVRGERDDGRTGAPQPACASSLRSSPRTSANDAASAVRKVVPQLKVLAAMTWTPVGPTTTWSIVAGEVGD